MAVAAAGAEGRSARGARPIEDPPSPDDERSSQGVWYDEPTHKTATARGKLSMRPCPEQKDAGLPPASLQEAASCEYDRSRYPFAELVAEALGLSDIADLSTLHDTKEGRKAQANPPRAGQCSFRRRWRAWLDGTDGRQGVDGTDGRWREVKDEETTRVMGREGRGTGMRRVGRGGVRRT